LREIKRIKMNTAEKLFEGVFNDRVFLSKMLKIALPVIIQNFISSFLNMIDTVMVGRLGEIEIAAVGIANQYFFFFNMFLIGTGAGCSVFISQFWGKRDIPNIKRILGVGMISIFVVASVFMAVGYISPKGIITLFNNDYAVIDLGSRYLKIVLLSYIFTGITFLYSFSLRAVGNASQPMLISVAALICNGILNYALIFGKFGAPVMGVEGAAIATLIARVLEAVLLGASVYLRKSVLAASLKELTNFGFSYIIKSYKTILPVILNDICWGLATLVYAAVYGRMGTQSVAVIQICNTVNHLFLVGAFGISSAAQVMIGNSIGAGEESQGRDYARRFSILSVLLGLALGAFLAAVSPLILNAFNVSEAVRGNAQIILYIISAVFVIRVLSIMYIVGILRGGGDALSAFLLEGVTMWFIGVPLTILGAFVLRLPIYAVYSLAVIEEAAKCIASVMRVRSGKWINNVTRGMK
jgi:putative MATE family efflux protein